MTDIQTPAQPNKPDPFDGSWTKFDMRDMSLLRAHMIHDSKCIKELDDDPFTQGFLIGGVSYMREVYGEYQNLQSNANITSTHYFIDGDGEHVSMRWLAHHLGK